MSWRNIKLESWLEFSVPRRSGVYVIAQVKRVLDLPVEWNIYCVGKSLDLRRRFREHAHPWRERNNSLRQSGTHSESGWEFWYRELPPDRLDQAERELIRTANPQANVIQYGGVS